MNSTISAKISTLCLLLCVQFLLAQEDRIEGTIITDYGWTYRVDDPDIPTDLETPFKVLFDLSTAPEDPSQMNPRINTVARFLNMHAEAGKSRDQLQVAAVFHGNASYSLLKNEAYKEKFGVDNPNIGLIKALQKADVPIILCGQTASHRNLSDDRRIEGIQLALSTMTAMVQWKQKGYTIINFN